MHSFLNSDCFRGKRCLREVLNSELCILNPKICSPPTFNSLKIKSVPLNLDLVSISFLAVAFLCFVFVLAVSQLPG